MKTIPRSGLLSVLTVAVLAVSAHGSDDPRTAHGRFTGDVKPLLYVTDVEESAPFFRDVLGFELLNYAGAEEDPYYAEMAAGDQRFGLHEPTERGQASRIGEQRIYFRVEDLGRHRDRVEARGAKPSEIVETDWMDYVIVRDPDGHEIVFAVTDPDRHPIDPW